MPESPWPSSPQAHARVAAVGYLVIIVAGIFAEFFVRSSLIVRGNPGATAANIIASESLFRLGIAGDLVMLVADVVVALALYQLFREVSRGLALLAAFFRLVQAGVLGANLLNLYVPLRLLGDPGSVAALGYDAAAGLSMVFLDGHAYGYALGLVFFGFSCIVLGYVVYRSGYVPRLFGAMLVVAGVAYLVDSFARTLLTRYADYAPVFEIGVFAPAFVAELSFCIWLLVKGVQVPVRRAA